MITTPPPPFCHMCSRALHIMKIMLDKQRAGGGGEWEREGRASAAKTNRKGEYKYESEYKHKYDM